MKAIVLAAAALALAACGPGPARQDGATGGAAAAPNAATLMASIATAEADFRQSADSVNKVIPLMRGDAKLFSTVGGDPAINGEYVFLAVIGDPHEGWKVFQIGDFNTWNVVDQSADRVVLAVSHSAVEEGSGDIVTYEQKIAVNVPTFEAQSVQITPVTGSGAQ